jgi:hypothetical protein
MNCYFEIRLRWYECTLHAVVSPAACIVLLSSVFLVFKNDESMLWARNACSEFIFILSSAFEINIVVHEERSFMWDYSFLLGTARRWGEGC